MQSEQSAVEVANKRRNAGGRTLPKDLRRVAAGEAPLYEAFQVLAQYDEEQAGAAADLREREIWSVTMILNASGIIWKHLPSPTLRFEIDDPNEPAPYHIELGHFAHLAALTTPSTDEQSLIAATTPCWARVFPNHERRCAEQTEAFAYSYVPISVAEAIDRLGFEPIPLKIGAVTREVGQALLAEEQAQRARYDRLLAVEQMLGWDPDAADASGDGAISTRWRKMRVLLAFVLSFWRGSAR